MQRFIEAFAPGDISCLFKVVADSDPERMHSLGLSFTVVEGVTARVSRAAQRSVTFNGLSFRFPTVETLLDSLTSDPLSVELASPLPISCGFGLSAASALATSYAVNELCSLNYSNRELALKAHIAEVKNLTGLGDVCVQYNGGCCGRFSPGSPLQAVLINVEEQPIYFKYFSPLHTDEVLGSDEKKQAINSAAEVALAEVKELVGSGVEPVDFRRIVDISLRFSQESKLLQDTQVIEYIKLVRSQGGHASMIMLGNALFSLQPFAGCSQTSLRKHAARLL